MHPSNNEARVQVFLKAIFRSLFFKKANVTINNLFSLGAVPVDSEAS